MCKTLGATVLRRGFGPADPICDAQDLGAASLASSLLVLRLQYPMLRNYDLVPVRRFLAAASSVSADVQGITRGSGWRTRKAPDEGESEALSRMGHVGPQPRLRSGTSAQTCRSLTASGSSDTGCSAGSVTCPCSGCCLFRIRGSFRVKGPVIILRFSSAGFDLILAINLLDLIPNANLLPFTYP